MFIVTAKHLPFVNYGTRHLPFYLHATLFQFPSKSCLICLLLQTTAKLPMNLNCRTNYLIGNIGMHSIITRHAHFYLLVSLSPNLPVAKATALSTASPCSSSASSRLLKANSPSNSVLYLITASFLPPCGMCTHITGGTRRRCSLESALPAIHRSGVRVFQRRISLPGPRGSRVLQKRVRSGRLSLYSPTGGINSRKRR